VFDKEISSLEASLEFTSSSPEELKSTQGKHREDEKAEISHLRKEFAYLEAYSRRENLIVECMREVSTEAERITRRYRFRDANIHGIGLESRTSRIY